MIIVEHRIGIGSYPYVLTSGILEQRVGVILIYVMSSRFGKHIVNTVASPTVLLHRVVDVCSPILNTALSLICINYHESGRLGPRLIRLKAFGQYHLFGGIHGIGNLEGRPCADIITLS